MIQAFILNNNGNSDEARDIFQEAMIVIYEKAVSGTFELNCLLKTYLYSVCRRLWLKRLQQLQRYVNLVENVEETVVVDEDLEIHDKHNANFAIMENAMNKIGEPCKSLLDAYYLQKKNMQEIAADFGYTNADNAKTQKYKCLVRLKKLFFAQYKNGQAHG
ncbi:MAG: sigma-70 family RNA polymerase sigma factor [Chitinophagaceae bacterium]|nr:sigma-70 family RNA polymerase sigma factor [Chitinophagaceae bacterium]